MVGWLATLLFGLKLKKATKSIIAGYFVSGCSDIVQSGQPPPFKNPGSATVQLSAKGTNEGRDHSALFRLLIYPYLTRKTLFHVKFKKRVEKQLNPNQRLFELISYHYTTNATCRNSYFLSLSP